MEGVSFAKFFLGEGWEDTFFDENTTLGHPMRRVDGKDGNRGPTHRRSAQENGPLPVEVPGPFVTTRVEQPNLLLGSRIDPCQVGALVVVVRQASEGQVCRNRAAAMLLGNDVVDLKGSRGEGLRQLAILATVARAGARDPPRPDPYRSASPLGCLFEDLSCRGVDYVQQTTEALVGIEFSLFRRSQSAARALAESFSIRARSCSTNLKRSSARAAGGESSSSN